MSERGESPREAYQRLLGTIKDKLSTGQAQPLHPLAIEDIRDRQTDRELKKKYALRFIWILIIQLLIMNVVFFCAGFSWLKYEQWVLGLYMGGTLAEVFLVVRLITKNLFPLRNNDQKSP